MSHLNSTQIAVLRRLDEEGGVLHAPIEDDIETLDELARRGLIEFPRSDENPLRDERSGEGHYVSVHATVTPAGRAALRDA